MLLLLCACFLISADDHTARLAEFGQNTTDDTGTAPADDTGTPTSSEELTITGVSPPFGTDAGGTTVIVTGGPFDSSTEVYFGTARADVEDVTRGAVTVTTPASGTVGLVDVTASGLAGSDQEDGAFTYWPDATGFVGATGELFWTEYAGGYWAATEQPYGRSTLRFVEPFDYQFYRYWAPELDTCVQYNDGVPEYVYDPDFEAYNAQSGTAIQRSPSATLELAWNAAEERFTYYDIPEAEMALGETYDLELTGTPGLPEVILPEVFPLPAPFHVSEPAIFGNNLPNITEDQHFAWTTDETGDAIVFQMGMYNNTGTGFQQEVHCAVRDVGSFTVPDGAWTEWTTGREVHILFGRYKSGNGLLPWNQGRIATASQLWYYGAGTAR